MAKVIYIDTETGSINPERAALLQISSIVEIDGELKGTQNLFLKPAPEAEVTGKALQIQGKTWADLDAPYRIDAAEGFKRFEAFLGQFVDRYNKTDKFVLKGFNSRYDEQVVRTFFTNHQNNYYGAWFWAPSVDIMAIAAQVYLNARANLPNFQLGTLLKAYRLLNEQGQPLAQDGTVVPDVPAFLHDSRTDICGSRRLDCLLTGRGWVPPVVWEVDPLEPAPIAHAA